MKVLLVATVQSHICQFHKPLVEVLHGKGCEVHVAARDNLAEKNGLKLDFAEKVFNVPFSRSPKSRENISAYKMLKKIIDEENYDIIHCNTPVGGILTRMAAKPLRKKCGTKVFYTAHGFHFYKGASKKNWVLFYPIEKHFSRVTDALITIVDEDYRLASEKFKCPVYRIHGVGVDRSRFVPADDTEKARLRSSMGYLPDEKLLLCVGELLPNKNQQMAIRAMPDILKSYPNAKLLIAGNGPEKENIEKLIASLGLRSSVELLGYRANIQDYHKVADVLVACSRREGLGMNVIESMMCGNPVVLSDNRGHRELIDDGRNGFLVPIDDSSELARKVIVVLEDESLYTNFSSNAREFSKKYSMDTVKTELAEIYGY